MPFVTTAAAPLCPHFKPDLNYTINAFYARTDKIKRSWRNVKTARCQLRFDSRVSCASSQTCIYWGLTRPTPRGSAQCVCGSLLAISSHKSCHLLRWKGAQCVRFSQSVNSSGFTRRSPHRSFFWPSKITFWVDYTLSAASPNYSPEQRWPANSQRSSAPSKRAPLQAQWQSGLRLTAQIASSRNHSMRLITSLFCVLMLKRAKFGNTANSLIFFFCPLKC